MKRKKEAFLKLGEGTRSRVIHKLVNGKHASAQFDDGISFGECSDVNTKISTKEDDELLAVSLVTTVTYNASIFYLIMNCECLEPYNCTVMDAEVRSNLTPRDTKWRKGMNKNCVGFFG